MSSQNQSSQQGLSLEAINHDLFRPAILQILRSQGYNVAPPSVIDTVIDIAGSYMEGIAARAARHAEHNNEFGFPGLPGITDVRMAMEEMGALGPCRDFTAQEMSGVEDTRGVDEFIRWATGKKNRRIRQIAGVDKSIAGDVGVDGVEEERQTDYLNALKRKHNKMDQESKYAGTILGRSIVEGEIAMEGGEDSDIRAWKRRKHEENELQYPVQPETAADPDSRPASSGLSSLADEDVAMMEMDF